MLVLSRKIGESIKIGDNITLRITDVKGEVVRLAIEAPKEIKIYRGEVYEAISKANQEAAQITLPADLQLPKG